MQVLGLVVDPRARGRGVGSLLWSAVPAAQLPDLMVWVDPEEERSLAVVRHWGFEPVSQGVTGRATLSMPPAPSELSSALDGYRFSVAESHTVEDARLDEILRLSSTYPEAAHEGPLTAAMVRMMFPEMFWVLAESPDGELAAVSGARLQRGDEWYLVYTGVLPSRRRLGLARAVKSRVHAEVWARGGRGISTTNEADNHEIRALNTSLGYEVTSRELRLLRPRPA